MNKSLEIKGHFSCSLLSSINCLPHFLQSHSHHTICRARFHLPRLPFFCHRFCGLLLAYEVLCCNGMEFLALLWILWCDTLVYGGTVIITSLPSSVLHLRSVSPSPRLRSMSTLVPPGGHLMNWCTYHIGITLSGHNIPSSPESVNCFL